MEQKRPRVKLVGNDGNAFAILARCREAAQKAKWTPEQIQAFLTEATSGSYDKLLATCMKYFDVR